MNVAASPLTLDAPGFTIFQLIIVPISKKFDVPLTAVRGLFTPSGLRPRAASRPL